MIDTSQFAFPKPGHAAGRTVESSHTYSRNKRRMWLQQDRACAQCERPLDSPNDGHRHHLSRPSALAAGGRSHGRGMGGGKRDDRYTVLVCVDCHLVLEGQMPATEVA